MLRMCVFGGFMIIGIALPAAELPPELVAAKQQVIDIATANTTSKDNIPQIRAELDPLVAQLETWFIGNRPADEVALTQVPWKSLWYDDPDIDFDINFGFFSYGLNREQIYQVIEDGFYYNVSDSNVTVGPLAFTLQGYLKGEYAIIRPPTDENFGEPRLNTVDLEFVANSIRLGALKSGADLKTLVLGVESGKIPSVTVPGPLGVTGELWNAYVDDDLRIAAGFDDKMPDVIDLYILTKVDRVQKSPKKVTVRDTSRR